MSQNEMKDVNLLVPELVALSQASQRVSNKHLAILNESQLFKGMHILYITASKCKPNALVLDQRWPTY